MAKIVISYRRVDTDAVAGRIRDRLAEYYSSDEIFMDIDSIPFGTDYRTHIREALVSSDILLAIMGPEWAGSESASSMRIKDPGDPVRIEIETAIEARIPLLPVLVAGAKMPKTENLPSSLEALPFYNAAEVASGRDFHLHIERLIYAIDQILKRRSRPFPWRTRRVPSRRRNILIAGAAMAAASLLVVVALGFWFGMPPRFAALFTDAPAQLPRKFIHATGSFERAGDTWVEYPQHQSGNFRFISKGLVGDYLYLIDPTRMENGDNNRAFHLRIPIKGGMVQWSFPNPFVWKDLYIATPEP